MAAAARTGRGRPARTGRGPDRRGLRRLALARVLTRDRPVLGLLRRLLPVGGGSRRGRRDRRGRHRRHHRGRGVHRLGGRGRRSGRLRRAESGRGCLGCAESGRRRGGRAEGRRRRRLRRRREAGGGGLLLHGRLLFGDLSAEVPQERVEASVEALADGGEPPDVLEVEVAEHHRALGAELRAGEGVPGDLLATRHDPQVTGADLGHLAGAVDRRGERQLVDVGGDAVEGDAERLGVTGLGPEQLHGLLGSLRLVEEDEVAVVGEPLFRVESETADVEGQPGRRDLHAHVQIGSRGEITDLGLVAALEFPGHA